jgi:hypothetical protein
MTILADRQPTPLGTTRQHDPPPELPDVDDAKQFYLYGRGTTGFSWVQHTSRLQQGYYAAPPLPEGLGRLARTLVENLTPLRALRDGWDGRRAKAVTLEALYGTILVLATVLDEDSELPQFFPLPSGGIQFEWYAEDQIEIEVNRAGEAHVLATAANGDVLAEGVFDPQPPSELAGIVAQLVKNLSARVAAERRRM